MEEHGAELDLLGFGIEHFGDDTWVVKSVPALLQHVDSQELVLEALDRLRRGIRAGTDRRHSIQD